MMQLSSPSNILGWDPSNPSSSNLLSHFSLPVRVAKTSKHTSFHMNYEPLEPKAELRQIKSPIFNIYLVFLVGGDVVGVDIAQPCNHNIHPSCPMGIKFLRKEIKPLP